LLGVSSGGFLVALVVLMLGLPQHVAQGISLVAQVPPTSLSGVIHYRRSGHLVSVRWVVLMSAGFIVGAVSGALAAGHIADIVLRWAFVGYLVLLGLLSLTRLKGTRDKAERPPVALGLATLFGVGIVSGLSSGLLGIGGGLAITAILAAGLKVPQHVSQALALAVTTLPLTLPAAWVYAMQERGLPWWVITGIVVGLWIGTVIGARLATFLSEHTLRLMMPVCIFAMAAYMAWRAAHA
jgi:uncharacterized membrane protein YfcA